MLYHRAVGVAHFVPLLTLLSMPWLCARAARAQGLPEIKSHAELQTVMTALDAALFDSFNKCDVEKFRRFFEQDVEFYHDQAGPGHGLDTVVDNLKKNICNGDVRREVVAGSLEAHRMKDFGAVQMGVHRFYHPKSKEAPGEARFIHLWRYRDGAWKITRVISFDHHAAK
ncbi:MAG: nuclear transport factor 2 family protein [Bryobacterales bacterium]|nr:nuclear transport factor 2 family protein [Bryobacterales bacterium]